MEKEITEDGSCPYCGEEVFSYKKGKHKHFRNMVKVFGSVHTNCNKCKKDVVCGKYTKTKILTVTREKFEELCVTGG